MKRNESKLTHADLARIRAAHKAKKDALRAWNNLAAELGLASGYLAKIVTEGRVPANLRPAPTHPQE